MSPIRIDAFQPDGFVTLPAVFTLAEAAAMAEALTAALVANAATDPAVLGSEGSIYGARNVLTLWPAATEAWRRPPLREPLEAILGPCLGLVRGLYFDKPPGNSWALPWHKDLTIAVRDNTLSSAGYLHPTRKAGVPHIEAPEPILANMLTARIHLDPVDDSNGPLHVIPGSHHDGKTLRLEGAPIRTLHAGAGDVLLIHPLVAHCSHHAHPQTVRHRRILHLEFAATAELSDGFAWHTFIPAQREDLLDSADRV